MGKPLMVVALTWSLMRASDTWLDSGSFLDTTLQLARQVFHSLGWS
jgi:hypothetical protein